MLLVDIKVYINVLDIQLINAHYHDFSANNHVFKTFSICNIYLNL